MRAAVLGRRSPSSFALGPWGAVHQPGSAFYLLPGRAWELLAGGLLALAPPPALARPRLGDAAVGGGARRHRSPRSPTTPRRPFPGPPHCCPASAPPGHRRGQRAAEALGAARRAAPGLARPDLLFALSVALARHRPGALRARTGPSARPRLAPLLATLALAGLSCGDRAALHRAHASCPARAGVRAALPRRAGSPWRSGRCSTSPGGVLPLATCRPPWRRSPTAISTGSRANAPCRPRRPPLPYPCRFGAAGAAPSLALWGNSYARMWVPALAQERSADGAAGLR